MILAAKCQPKIDILKDVYNAGIEAVELYLEVIKEDKKDFELDTKFIGIQEIEV